jgi:hypothetical protein
MSFISVGVVINIKELPEHRVDHRLFETIKRRCTEGFMNKSRYLELWVFARDTPYSLFGALSRIDRVVLNALVYGVNFGLDRQIFTADAFNLVA